MKKLIVIFLTIGLSACGYTPIKDKQFLDVDKHKMEYAYHPNKPPTIVFLSGWGVKMDFWLPMYQYFGKNYSVFAYNRLGYGDSDNPSQAQSAKVIAQQLHDLLHAKGIKPPYILVGHSIAGLYLDIYPRMFPKEVSGEVFVDPSHPQQMDRADESGMSLGLLHFITSLFPSKASEIKSWHTSQDQIFHAGDFPPIPIIIITTEKTAQAAGGMKDTLHKQLARLSPLGKQVYAKHSSHMSVLQDDPDVVINSIKEVIHEQGKIQASHRQSGQTMHGNS